MMKKNKGRKKGGKKINQFFINDEEVTMPME